MNKLSPKQIGEWIIDNFDMYDVIDQYGIVNTLNHFAEYEILEHCSEDSIREKYFEFAPLNKLL